jgi:TBC1 domain family protein 5
VRDTIALDLERLHPGDDFYAAADVQSALLDVLLVWSLENPSVGYRQGMHELASLVFSQGANDANAANAAAGGGHVWGAGAEAPSEAVRDDAPGGAVHVQVNLSVYP